MKEKFFVLFLIMFCSISVSFGQIRKTGNSSGSSRSINGTFRLYHPQKFRKFFNEVKISSVGKGKLKVGFDIVYPKLDTAGIPIISGKRQIEGTALIKGNSASFTSDEFASCSIMIKFIGQGMIAVLQESEPTDCGFGRKDLATGNYRKISGSKPKFKDEIPQPKTETSATP
jgi:hypothetical protein